MKGTGIEWGDKPAPLHVMDAPEEFWVGRVVKKIEKPIDYGHIMGFSRNAGHEVVIRVAWTDGAERLIHPASIELL